MPGFRIHILFVALGVLICGLAADGEGAEYRYGLALRENVLLLRSPVSTGGAALPLAAGTFGTSETALRGWTGISGERWSFLASVETRGSFTSARAPVGGLSGFFVQGSPLQRWDLTWEHTQSVSTTVRTRVEDLSLTLRAGPVDLEIGRQPISLGTSHFVSVLDVIAPFAPGYLDATYKPGVDAVRVRTAVGMTGEAEIIAVGADPWEQGALLGRVRVPLLGQDFLALGGRFRERGFGGIAWEGEIAPFAIWGELGLFERKPEEEPFFAGWSEAAFSGIAGMEVDIPFEIRAGLAAMYQDFGAREPEDLPIAYASAPFREGWVFLGSAGYAVLTASRRLHPLITSSFSGLTNLTDGSTLWQPQVTFSTGENTDLSVYGWSGTGPGPRTDGPALVPRSEFGLIPDGTGLYARWFF